MDTQHHFGYGYYRVWANDTRVEPVAIFTAPHKTCTTVRACYRLLPIAERFTDYPDLVTALEKAKAGALHYIDQLIGRGDAGLAELLQYRIDHYEDLNINLVEDNIGRIKCLLKKDAFFKWRPYRINH